MKIFIAKRWTVCYNGKKGGFPMKYIKLDEIEETLSGKEILIEKKSKRQMKEINLSDHIFNHKIESFFRGVAS